MNYADDRRDRRARDGALEDVSSLSNDDSLPHDDAATVLRDGGRNRAALHHYGVAWLRDPASAQAAGDYAQMAALAGFSQLGLVALLVYRRILGSTIGSSVQKNNENEEADAIRQLLRTEMVANGRGDSGCGGQAGCGGAAATWMIPMTDAAIEQVLNCIDDYCHYRIVALHYRRQQQKESGKNASVAAAAVPTAHKLIKLLTDGETVVCDADDDDDARPPIPALLQFWTTIAN